MRKKMNSMPWISILVALASAVGIYFLPDYHWWFLAILLLNLLFSLVFSKRYSPGALTICRLLVGALFIFSSFTKGVDPLGTKYKMLDYLSAYHMTWLNNLAMVLAVLMILAEFIVGFCLITKMLPRLAVLGATLLMLFFTFTTLFDALYNMVPDCGCFGTAIKMSNWQTFYKNLVIDTLLIPLIMNNKLLENKLGKGVQWLIAILFALAFLGFELYNYRHLPVVDFMDWKVGKQMSASSNEETKIYLTYKNKATGEKQEFLSPNYPWNDSVWMSEWEFVQQRMEGGTKFLGFSALDEDDNDVTDLILDTENLLMFTSHDLAKVTEKEWAKVKEITEEAGSRGYYVVWVVANEPEYVEQLREKYDFLYEVYYADALEIKPIVRSNPGLIWLDNGLVKDKWSSTDFKKVLKVL
ncbi:MAG: DoxX family protein [Bacteroidales bacterium]|nr:DoxX family protein [Bacteroidales bacterium]MBR6227760.1 DoxX family protein [Bacteroidales bacterium]